MKFFEVVPSELFSPLASPNRILYADVLDVRSIPRKLENTGRCLVFNAARQAGAGTGGCYV